MAALTLSVVVPNRNHAHFLPRCLDAILAQSRQPDEIIAIDDASTDNSAAVIDGYAGRHKLIRTIELAAHEGVVRVVNRGLAAARGTHVLFAAADDWLLPGMIGRSMALLERYPAAGLCSGLSLVADDSGRAPRPLRTRVVLKGPGYIEPAHAASLLAQDDSWFMGNTAILNRVAAVNAGGFRAALMSYCDMFLYQLLALTHGACFIPAALGVWSRLDSGYSSTTFANPERLLDVANAVTGLMTGVFYDRFAPPHVAGVERRLRYWAASGVVAAAPGQTRRFLSALPRMRAIDVPIVGALLRVPILGRRLVRLYLFFRLRRRDVVAVARRHLFWILFGRALT